MYSRNAAGHLAARVRSLLDGVRPPSIGLAARELGVIESELREIIQYETPYPSTAVLAALVAYYGVDAGWLLTGEYSPSRHRADAEADDTPTTLVSRLLRAANDAESGTT